MDGERGSGRSVLAARHDDDEDDAAMNFNLSILSLAIKKGFKI